MPIDTSDPQSPGWWLQRLARKLEGRQKRLQDLDDRMRGDAPLPHVADNVREVYRRFQRKSRTNLAELIVESARDRMTPIGIRTAASDDESDELAMEIWNANGLAVESSDVHESFLGMGDGYVIVGPGEGDDDVPLITGEDPRQVVTIHDPKAQRRVRAAAKLFHDDEEQRDYAYLYLPGRVYRATRDVRRDLRNPTVRFNSSTWDWDDDYEGDDGKSLGSGLDDVMPVVRFRNRRGVGDFEQHVDLLDRIDHQVLQRMVIATMQAFRQRAIKGDLPTHDDEGKEIDYDKVFEADPGALWLIPGVVEMWESGVVDLSPVLSAVKDDLRMLAAVTKTPLNQLMPDEVAQSAEGASFMREGLIFRVEDRMARAGESWRDVIALAFRIMGDTARADRGKISVLWAPPERRSLAEKADASSKAQDIPWRSRMIHVWGFTPPQVDQMETERTQDALLASLAALTADQSAPAPAETGTGDAAQ